MAVGQGALQSGFSYLAVGRETTFGTYNTCTGGLDFLSMSIKTMKENKILEQVQRSRTYSKTAALGKTVEGDFEFYFQPRLQACGDLLQNAFGGTVTSATATGETTGAGASSAITHTFNIGSMDQSYPSLCLNVRKGPKTLGKVFEYSGVRIDSIEFSAEIDSPLKTKVGVIAVNSSITGNDLETTTTQFVPTTSVLNFDAGRLSVEPTFASLTSASFWHVQNVNFSINNSLKKDAASRRIGSDVLQVLPPGIASFNLSCQVRYDTTTAFDAMLNATELALQLEFLGPTLPGSQVRQGLKFNFPKVVVLDADDPEVGGPDEILMSNVTFHVLQDDSSVGGYAVQALLTNQRTNFA